MNNNQIIADAVRGIQKCVSVLRNVSVSHGSPDFITAMQGIEAASIQILDALDMPVPLTTTPEGMHELRGVLTEKLNAGRLVVMFIKSDGTMRNMLCTLSGTDTPALALDRAAAEKAGKEPRKQSPDVLPVWDIDAGGWRSFRLDSVTGFQESR